MTQPARESRDAARTNLIELSLRSEAEARLDRNESPWDWPESLKQKIARRLADVPWHRYPSDPSAIEHLLAKTNHVEPEMVLTAAGSFPLIELVMRELGRAAGHVVVADPSFDQFNVVTERVGVPRATWPLDDAYQFDLARVPNVSQKAMFLLASPNNPTGTVLPLPTLCRLLCEWPMATFVIDEAYIEFGGASALELLAQFENLIILRTFSKAMATAGIRFGYLLASRRITQALRAKATPYQLNVLTQTVVEALLTDEAALALQRSRVRLVIEEREALKRSLISLASVSEAFVVADSRANFNFIRFHAQGAAQMVARELASHGLLVKSISTSPGEALRLTVGDARQNARCLAVIAQMFGQETGNG